MLQLDPLDRFSIERIYNHDWLNEKMATFAEVKKFALGFQ
jgi:hypothetical protein